MKYISYSQSCSFWGVCLKRKRYDRGKKVASHHTGAEEMGQPSSQWRQRQLLQSYTTEKKVNFLLRSDYIGSISSSRFWLQQTKFCFWSDNTIYVNHCGDINYFIAQMRQLNSQWRLLQPLQSFPTDTTAFLWQSLHFRFILNAMTSNVFNVSCPLNKTFRPEATFHRVTNCRLVP